MITKKTLKSKIMYAPGAYSITINLNDAHQYFSKPYRLQKAKSFLNEQIIYYPTKGLHYCLYCELSEPLNNTLSINGPRIHFHGILFMDSPKAVRYFLLQGWYRLSRYSKFDLDSIGNPEVWHQYCIKQQHIMHTLPLRSGMVLFDVNKKLTEEEHGKILK